LWRFFYSYLLQQYWKNDDERRRTMDVLKGVIEKETREICELAEPHMAGKTVRVNGAVHTIRDMGEVAFVVLRKREGLLQCVFEEGITKFDLKELQEADTIEVTGVVKPEERAPHGVEVRMEKIRVLSRSAEPLPLAVSKWRLNTSLEAKLNMRSIALRNIRERAKFKVQEGIVRGFRDFLYQKGFTEIRTPKIGAKGAEGGSNVFKLDYFHRPAVLAQSPQFYKQMMVGVFDRVFETAPVFRAEKHNTKRHLNEYTSLDFEMGYIDGFEDIMGMETGFLQYTMELLRKEYAKELSILKVELPKTEEIPAVRFDQAKEMAAEKYKRKIKNPYDLEPEEEVLISRLFQEDYGADFVFVTHYPAKKRPFYAMDDPEDSRFTLSFDLLFRGMEITTGGQRIHDYHLLLDKIAARGMTEERMEQYLDAFKYGMPPHGGLGIGLERLTMKLLGEENVRETTLFPRDLGRLEP
jgi:nondiscriminating aspartyl-tRNA synthetase